MRIAATIPLEADSKVTWKEILLMFSILLLTGNPYIDDIFQPLIIISFIIPLSHILKNYRKSVSFNTIFIFIFFLGYEVMHAVMYKLDYSMTIFKIFLVLILAKVTVDILKDRFVETLVMTMVIISLISFVFVIISYIPGINRFLYSLGETLFPIEKDWKGFAPSTIIIYTFSWEFFTGELSYVRNAGIFWESGAFAVFLNITLFLYYSTKSIKTTKELFDRNATILIIAAVSTTSTMGILALLLVLLYFSNQIKSIVRYLLVIMIILVTVLSFTTIDFLGNKVRQQLSESGTTNNRFGSAIKDFQDFSERPLFGWSRRNEVVFGTTEFTAETHRPNGLTNQLRSYGLIYNFIYFLLVFISFRNAYRYFHFRPKNLTAMFGIILLFIVSFSEPIFDLLFLKSLIFLSQAYSLPAANKMRHLSKPFYFENDTSSPTIKRLTF